MSTTNDAVVICGGQGKHEMFMQLMEIGRPSRRVDFLLSVQQPEVKGKLVNGEKLSVRIQGIAAEDGSGNGWAISGVIRSAPDWLTQLFGDERLFRGYYDTHKREGVIRPGAWRS